MKSDIENSEIEAVTRALKAKMVKAAFLHVDRIDARTLIALQMAGILKRGVPQDKIPADVLEILSDPTHPRRVASSLGPFIFYQNATEPNQQYVLDMTSVLLSGEVSLRTAAIVHLEVMATSEPPKLTPPTKSTLQSRRADIVNESADIWQPAALELRDTLGNDLLYQIAAVEQSLEGHFEDGLKEYFPKVLRPSIASLEALELKIVKPSEQKKDMVGAISECANRDSLHVACDEYQAVAGFLPLADDYSLTRVVELWQERHNTPLNLWESLWDWADKKKSPLARYHVCMVFLAKPEWRAQGQERVLWQEILEIISNPSSEDHSLRWRHEWAVRKELAQHYLRFLESRSPTALGEPLASFSWWLAERVATLLGHAAEASSKLRNVAIIPEAESSDFAWKLSLPRIAPSVFAKATHLGAGPWSLSALSRMKGQTIEALSAALDEQLANRFDRSFAAVIMSGFPLEAAPPGDAVYAFETTLSESVAAWDTRREDSAGAKPANAIASMYAKLSKPVEFVPALQKIYEEDELNQMIVAHWAKSLAIQGLLPRDEVWKCLSDSAWRKPTFIKVIDAALDQLFLAFSLALHSNDNVWQAGLPHVYASACEEAGDNAERRGVLFAFTAISGIHTYSVSALQRLLASSQRSTYLELSNRLQNALLSNRGNPPWLTARIRAVLAATAAA